MKPPSEALARKILNRRATPDTGSGPLCERCGRGGPLTLHHRVKRSQGGTWGLENIVLLCGSGVTGCHGWVEANPAESEAEGYWVPPWKDPGRVAILIQSRLYVRLLPSGFIERIARKQ